uniref:FBA_2 domain-containing protein n=1 Tax=Caenorhabditis tropicalis TaxID=1561998 RepID=A0A1I7TER5_9PELO
MNSFLKSWMNGGNSIMKYLSVRMKKYDLRSILNGFELDSQSLHFHSGIEIRRKSDGKVALIRMSGVRTFSMYVWPDWKGLPYPVDNPNQLS